MNTRIHSYPARTKPGTFSIALRETGCHDLRCACGSLLAKLVEGGVELKCRRCKQAVVIPLSDSSEILEKSSRFL